MVRRARGNKRTRNRRSRGKGGASLPNRNRSKNDYWDQVGKRVDTSYKVLGHPQQLSRPAEEGKHYTVLAYTDWADQFIPTVIKWNHGEVDNLTDQSKSEENLRKSYQHLAEQNKSAVKPKAQIRIGDRIFTEHTGAYTVKEAREKAEDIRKRGYNARVIKTGLGYTVYAAKKKGGR